MDKTQMQCANRFGHREIQKDSPQTKTLSFPLVPCNWGDRERLPVACTLAQFPHPPLTPGRASA
eukprot:scaffold12560_cov107-Isochrysis_galbana.AAC.2